MNKLVVGRNEGNGYMQKEQFRVPVLSTTKGCMLKHLSAAISIYTRKKIFVIKKEGEHLYEGNIESFEGFENE